MIELIIIKLILIYNIYIKYNDIIALNLSSKELKNIFATICSLHDSFKKDLTIDDVELAFKSGLDMDDKKYAPYQALFSELRKIEVSPEIAESALESFKERGWLSTIAMTSLEALEGRKTAQDVLNLLDSRSQAAESEDLNSIEFVTDDLSELKQQTIAKVGLRWRLKALNQALGSLRQGDMGFIFARPETGKTTFLASEVSFMAVQAISPILWFNNEEQGNKVMLRNYQASLGLTLTELFTDVEGNKQQFYTNTKGNIKMIDRAHITKSDVEKICKLYKPSLIIFDQIDKIKGFAADREDLVLGAIYQWARELAKTYAPVIGVCQADGSGEGQRWLTMANVANAKTSKQAEADWILGIGKVNESGMEYVRYLHLSKNKLMGDEDSISSMRHGRMEVLIEPEIARYKDLV